jgi:galactokinase
MSHAALRNAFAEFFDGAPSYLSRAPGRVNLIGEHTDYNGLPVLPMALQREVCVALRPRDDGRVVLRNVDPRFPPTAFEIGPVIPPDVTGSWGNYVRAPASELARRHAIRRGFDGVVSSNLPDASGLSSSSALVNAVGLALAHVNEVPVEVNAFAALMADAEQYVGTRGGGMDQAISLGARDRCAARITFDPVRLHHVTVPENWHVVVADTGVRAEKSGSAQAVYNRRRAECEEAFRIVSARAATAGLTGQRLTRWPELVGVLDADTLVALGEEVLDATLQRRFRHVVREAERVENAVDRMNAADIAGFGALMDASHESLRSDFRVSSAELDELVALAKSAGAAGARLTGAGFGGCIVALTNGQAVGGVLDTLMRAYYDARGLTERIDDRLFVAIPCAGASVGTMG